MLSFELDEIATSRASHAVRNDNYFWAPDRSLGSPLCFEEGGEVGDVLDYVVGCGVGVGGGFCMDAVRAY